AARLHVGGIQPDIGPIALQWPVEEGGDLAVNLAAQPADLALRDAGHAHRLDQFVDGAGRYALHVGLLDHCGQSLLGHPARLQESRKIAPLAQLRYAQLDRACAGLPVAIAVSIAVVDPLGAAFAMPAPVSLSTSSAIRRCAAKPIISRSKSTSELFSKSARRLIISVVIVGSSVRLKGFNQTLPKLYGDHRRGEVASRRLTRGGRCGGLLTHRSYTTRWDTTETESPMSLPSREDSPPP